MSTERHQIVIAGLSVQIVRKPIKNLHLGVYPPNGRVRVAVPIAVSDHAVRLAVVGKLGWIKRQRARFEAQARQSKRDIATGESHYLFGRRYRLRLVPGGTIGKIVVRSNSTIELRGRPGMDGVQRERVLQRWYRQELKVVVPGVLDKWQAILGVQAAGWTIRRMKTKWGSCNPESHRIWLNLELAKKPAQCLEYIIVHELVHLIERRHNDRFMSIMDKHLPHWRLLRAELNAAPLAHENWSY
jgi:predicted metal-dependent hydrolase